MDSHLHYDSEADIALLSVERGRAVSERHAWGLIDRDPVDEHLMGFEIWRASAVLPAELLATLPRAEKPKASAA